MVTHVTGQHYSPRFKGDPNALSSPFDETIEGTGSFNVMRTIFLNSLRAAVEIYNRENRGLYVLRGEDADTIEAQLDGQTIRDKQGQFGEGQEFTARVKGKGHVEATWTPSLSPNARR